MIKKTSKSRGYNQLSFHSRLSSQLSYLPMSIPFAAPHQYILAPIFCPTALLSVSPLHVYLLCHKLYPIDDPPPPKNLLPPQSKNSHNDREMMKRRKKEERW